MTYGDSGSYSVYNSSFAVSATLDPGTYYFELYNPKATDGTYVAWDVTSTSQSSANAFIYYPEDSSSSPIQQTYSLQLFDQSQAVPEPSVATGLCASLLGLALLYLRQRKAKR